MWQWTIDTAVHTVYQIEHHFVWITQYLYQVLSGEIAERVRDLVRQTREAFERRIIKGVVSKDHVHSLVSAPPNRAPSEIMRRIKGRTSSCLFEAFPHLKKRYWGKHFWAHGYFCATAAQMTDEMIKHYLEHHLSLIQTIILKWSRIKTRRLVDAYPDFQTVIRTHPFKWVVVKLT
jgi:putative transposase